LTRGDSQTTTGSLIAACSGDKIVVAPDLREKAREVLDDHCGNCHRPNLATSEPRALAVFDLGQREFASSMTNMQLRDVQFRLENLVDVEDATFGGTTEQAEIGWFTAFMIAELTQRERLD
jgi:hypothetical protein